MVRFLCHICTEGHTIPDLRYLPCGHYLCKTCLATYLDTSGARRGSRRPCPECREPFTPSSAQRLFLDLADPADAEPEADQHRVVHSDALHGHIEHARAMAARLALNGTAQNAANVTGAMGAVVRSMHADDCYLDLLKAVSANLTGQFAELARQKAAIARLEADLRGAAENARRAETLAAEAIETTSQAGEENRRLKAEVEGLLDKANRARAEHEKAVAGKDEELRMLRGNITLFKKRDQKRKEEREQWQREAREKDERLALLEREVREREERIERLEESRSRAATSQAGSSYYGSREASLEIEDAQPSPVREQPHRRDEQENQQPLHTSRTLNVAAAITRKRKDAPISDALPALDIPDDDDLGRVDAGPRRAAPLPRGPQFPSNWNLAGPAKKRRAATDPANALTAAFPIAVDSKGRPKGAVVLGSRKKMGAKS